MKLSTLIDPRFSTSLEKLSREPLPLKTAFRLKGIMNVIKDEHLKYEEVRTEALKKYGLKNKDTSIKVDEKNNVQFDKEGLQAFSKELTDLLNVEISLNAIQISELGDNIKLSLEDVHLLEGLLVE